MKLTGLGTRRQAIALGGLALLLVLFLVRRAIGGGGSTPAADSGTASPARAVSADADEAGAAPSRGRRPKVREVSPDEVPPLKPDDLAPPKPASASLASRDLFDFRPPTPVPPPPPTPAPTPLPVCGESRFTGPCPATPPPPPTPTPSPPEIGFRFIGSFGPKDDPIAVLVQGDRIVNARANDVVFDRFRIVRVGYESVDVGFVAGVWSWKETRRLAITP